MGEVSLYAHWLPVYALPGIRREVLSADFLRAALLFVGGQQRFVRSLGDRAVQVRISAGVIPG